MILMISLLFVSSGVLSEVSSSNGVLVWHGTAWTGFWVLLHPAGWVFPFFLAPCSSV